MSIKNSFHPFDVIVNVSVVSGMIILSLAALSFLVIAFGSIGSLVIGAL